MKKLTIILAVIFLVSSIPAVFADDNMQSVLISVKDRVDIPEKFSEFSSIVYSDEDGVRYEFEWNTSEDAEGWGYLHVSADGEGIITSFGCYDYSAESTYGHGKKIPDISEGEAFDIAKDFFAKINPQICGEFAPLEALYSYGDYNVSFVRMANGIKTDDKTFVSVDGETGAISSFYLNYTRVSSFPALDEILSSEEAKKVLQNGNALNKIYRVFGEDKEARIVYELSDFNIINAFSGEKYTYTEYNGAVEDNAGSGTMEAMASKSDSRLTEKEISVLEEIDGLMTETEIEAKLRAMPELAIGDAKAVSTHLVKRGEKYIRNMYFTAENADFSTSVDAASGQLLDFGAYHYDDKGETVPADEFIQKYYPEYIKRTVLKDEGRVRIENGIEFPQNSIRATKDKENGQIIYFSIDFDDDVKFSNPNETISFDEAYKSAFAASEPELKYLLNKNNAVPVYALSFEYFDFIDAVSGKLINYMGEVQEKPENLKYEYTDIEGHYAETAVKALAKIGAGFEGGAFEPDKTITQKDFAALVSQCVYDYIIFKGGRFDKEATADGCIIYGAIKKDEYYPDEPLPREKAVQILLKAMGYEEFASIEGIFKTDFADNADISPELLGYAAIASGLKIVNGSGGYFYPKENITRGQAAIIIYNYLSK